MSDSASVSSRSTRNGNEQQKVAVQQTDAQVNFATVVRKPNSILQAFQQIKNAQDSISHPRVFYDVDVGESRFICSPYVMVSTALLEKMIHDSTGVFHGSTIQVLCFDPNDDYSSRQSAKTNKLAAGKILNGKNKEQKSQSLIHDDEWVVQLEKQLDAPHIVAFLERSAKKISLGYQACVQKSTQEGKACMTMRDTRHFENAIKMEPELVCVHVPEYTWQPVERIWKKKQQNRVVFKADEEKPPEVVPVRSDYFERRSSKRLRLHRHP